jgi:hypothetical protein
MKGYNLKIHLPGENSMIEQTSRLPSLDLIANYVLALCERYTATMQNLRSTDFVLEWIHGDAFKISP